MDTFQNGFQFTSLGFFQFSIAPSAPIENLSKIEIALQKSPPPPGSLIVLPELWPSGFYYDDLEQIARQSKAALKKLHRIAESYSIVIGGSLVEEGGHGDCFYNTLSMAGAGVSGRIRKRNLFAPIDEDRWFKQGGNQEPLSTPYGLVGGAICYDLRFPETLLEMCRQGADVLAVSAQWPVSRIEHWRILLQARAIENQTYVVSCNGVGNCSGVDLGGTSLVVDPDGSIILEAGRAESLLWIPVDKDRAYSFRNRFARSVKE